MAITVTVLEEGGTTTNNTIHSTGALTLTPAARRVFYVVVMAAKASTTDDPSGSGTFVTNNGTWTKTRSLACVTGSQKRLTIWRSIDASGLGVFTADYTNTQIGFLRFVLQVDEVDIGGTNGSACQVQNQVTNNTSTVITTTVTLSAFGDATNNMAMIFVLDQINAIPALKASYSGATGQTIATPDMGGRVGWIIGEDTSPNMTHSTSESGAVAFELKYDSGAADVAGSLTNPGIVKRLVHGGLVG